MSENHSSLIELGIDATCSDLLMQTAKWSKFLSIVGFIVAGLMAVAGFFMGAVFSSMADIAEQFKMLGSIGGVVVGIVYLIFAVIYAIPNYYRLVFANKTILALQTNDQVALTEAFSKLKSFNKFWGILTIVIISLYVLLFLFGMSAAFMAM